MNWLFSGGHTYTFSVGAAGCVGKSGVRTWLDSGLVDDFDLRRLCLANQHHSAPTGFRDGDVF